MKTAAHVLLAALSMGTAFSSDSWKKHSIDPAMPLQHLAGADGVRLSDANGDGRLDIVTGWEEGKSIRIAIQPEPDKLRTPWETVTVGRVSSAEDAVFADLDGDGNLDVVSATEGKSRTVYVHWAPEAKGDLMDENAWETNAFPEGEGSQWWMYTLPHDVDQDGDIDLLIGSKNAKGSLTLFENPGHDSARDLSLWKTRRVADAGWIMSIRLLETPKGKAVLYSDRKGKSSGVYLVPLLPNAPWLGEPIRIGATGEEVMFLDVGHLDDDKNLDVVAAIRPDIVRVYYQPESPFQEWADTADFDPISQETFGSVKAVRIGDLDGDRLPDIAITCERADGKKKGAMWMNLHSEVTAISDAEGVKYDRIELLDLDRDGDLDMITCEERAGLGVVWFENPLK